MRYDREARDNVKERARRLRKVGSTAEYQLRTYLRRAGEKKILRKPAVGRCIADLGLPFRNLIIEVYRPDDPRLRAQTRRRNWMSNMGLNVLQLPSDDILKNPERIIQKINFLFLSGEEMRSRFYAAMKAARSKSYWVEDEI
jgi:very-short-patch-repair endonuclease